jgi:hypothetical protein
LINETAISKDQTAPSSRETAQTALIFAAFSSVLNLSRSGIELELVLVLGLLRLEEAIANANAEAMEESGRLLCTLKIPIQSKRY